MTVKKFIATMLCISGLLLGQTVSSSLRAVVVDATGSSVPGAECVLTNKGTGSTASANADTQGLCVFPNVLAGTYDVAVKAKGFKTLEAKDIVVTANENRTLGRLQLEIGGTAETVTVTAEVSQIQLASAEKSGTINTSQLQNIAIKGRDFFALLNTVPGVVDNFSQARETASPDSIRGTFINGGRENQKNLAIDGITDLDTGSNSTVHFQPNMDAISEIKILTSNYQAEFGRNGGGVITVITKSGTREFHGTGYWNYRHESLNANSFFNNRNNVSKNPYRYRINGFSVGGPAYIPGKLNRNKDKLFFFVSQEYVGMKRDHGQRFTTMPTDAERRGDFSMSRDGNGNPIIVQDPTQNKAPFPGNIIPQSRFNALGLKMLNFLPKPNWVDPDPRQFYQRNYRTAYSGSYPKRQDMFRIDANVTSSMQVYYRFIKDKDEQTVPWGLWVNGNQNFDMTPTIFGQPGKGHNFHVQNMFSSTLINEFIFGKSRNNLYFYPEDPSKIDRALVGNPPEWYKDSGTGVTYVDKINYVPNMTFGGGIGNSPQVHFGNIPYENYNNIWSFVDNISKVTGSHTLKAGIYIERTQKYQVGGGNYRGNFSFDRNANNPLDSNHPFANALLGNFNSYSEATARVNGDWWFWNFEWFAQDNWKVSRRLTLDFGMRFYHLPPQTDKNKTIASFDPYAYNRSKAPALYMPIMDGNRRVAVNPLNGQLAPAPLIGLFVPGSGNTTNGAFVGGEGGYPAGLYKVPWLAFGPRFGFAFDVFGNGKTAVRGGFGMFQDRMQGNPTMNTNGNPPVAFTPTLSFGSLDTYANNPGATGPSNINTLFGDQKFSRTMNFSFGIQQQISTWAVDASYVGSVSNHLMAQININPIPMYARFVDRNPQNADPTNRTVPLPDNFLRPYLGWGDINYRTNGFNSNYHSLQTSVNKRYGNGLQVGIAYTWSKVLSVADGDTSGVSPYFSPRDRNYGPAGFDRPHVFVANYIYDTPKIGERLGWKPLGWITDNWQISGMTTLQSGSPFTPGFGLVRSEEWTGSAEGARVDVIGNPNLPKSERTFDRWFNTAAFAMPAKGTFGNAGVNIMRNPGINNWDLSITKKIPLASEERWLQFRTEMFNAWNHTQYSGMGTGTSFDNATGKNTSTTFGVINGTRPPRVMQLSLKLYF